MIIHPFSSSICGMSFNKKRYYLNSNIDQLNDETYSLNHYYGDITSSEQLLCNEEDITESRKYNDNYDE